jgi:hypothetical protein
VWSAHAFAEAATLVEPIEERARLAGIAHGMLEDAARAWCASVRQLDGAAEQGEIAALHALTRPIGRLLAHVEREIEIGRRERARSAERSRLN